MIRKVKLKLVNHYSLTAHFDGLSKTSLVFLICFPEGKKKKKKIAILFNYCHITEHNTEQCLYG